MAQLWGLDGSTNPRAQTSNSSPKCLLRLLRFVGGALSGHPPAPGGVKKFLPHSLTLTLSLSLSLPFLPCRIHRCLSSAFALIFLHSQSWQRRCFTLLHGCTTRSTSFSRNPLLPPPSCSLLLLLTPAPYSFAPGCDSANFAKLFITLVGPFLLPNLKSMHADHAKHSAAQHNTTHPPVTAGVSIPLLLAVIILLIYGS